MKVGLVILSLILMLTSIQTLTGESANAIPAFMLIRYGTCRDINPITAEPISLTDEFSRNDSKIYAWFMIGYTLPTNATYTWKWFDPIGNLYQETSLNHSGNGPWSIYGEPLDVRTIPLERRVGLWHIDVYIDNILLFRQDFTIGKYLVVVAVKGLPKTLKTTVIVDGSQTEQIQGSTDYTFQFDEGTFHILVFERYVSGGEGIRYVTTTEALNISGRELGKVDYSAQYYLQVNSPFGNPEGSGWYQKGVTANFSITSPTYDYLATKHTFAGWTGDYMGSEPFGAMEMDGPRTVDALWESDYSLTYILLGSILAIMMAISAVKIRRKRAARVRSI